MEITRTILGASILLLVSTQASTSVMSKETNKLNSFRSLNGSYNNLTNENWGAANTSQMRMVTPDYADEFGSPRSGDGNLPAPRAVSNVTSAQTDPTISSNLASGWLWQWGQFVDHDLVLTNTATPRESLNISVPMGRLIFRPLLHWHRCHPAITIRIHFG